VVGGGGHAKVLIASLLSQSLSIVGYVDPAGRCDPILGVNYLGDDGVILRSGRKDLRLANGVGSVGSGSRRSDVFRHFRKLGFRFISVIHPTATVAQEVYLGEGVQIMAGAVVQTGTRLGANCIINTGALVDHDCDIRAHAHVAPGAVLSGQVRIDVGAHIGTGACVIHTVRVGAWSVVGAGAAVVEDVPAQTTVVGVPARRMRK